MSRWGTACWIRETICEQVSEDFYEKYGNEVIGYFELLTDDYGDLEEDITEQHILVYCLGIILRNEIQFEYEFNEPFNSFMKAFLEAYIVV